MPENAAPEPVEEFERGPTQTTKRGQADPSIRLMEQSLIRSLNPDVAKGVSHEGLRSMAVMAALAGHDRHVEMEHMAHFLDDLGEIHMLTREIELGQKFRVVLEKLHPKSLPVIDENLAVTRSKLAAVRKHLLSRVELMTKCPVDGEIIH